MDTNWLEKNLTYLEKYVQPKSLLKPSNFYSIYDGSEKSLNNANKIISNHIGIKIDTEVKFDHTLKVSGDIKYHINSKPPKLRILISSRYRDDKKAIGEILAHENAHAFLFLNNIIINSKNNIEKEMFTDLTGVVLGLGQFILNGTRVQSIVRSTLTGNVSTKTTLKLGYLNDELIEYSMGKIGNTNYE